MRIEDREAASSVVSIGDYDGGRGKGAYLAIDRLI